MSDQTAELPTFDQCDLETVREIGLAYTTIMLSDSCDKATADAILTALGDTDPRQYIGGEWVALSLRQYARLRKYARWGRLAIPTPTP